MRFRVPIRFVIGAALLATGAAAPAGGPVLAALRGIEPGQWQLTVRDDATAPPRLVCVGNPAVFLQLRHPHQSCATLVIADDPNSATVQYNCPATGHGRTTINVDGPRALRIDTQGVTNEGPFDAAYAATRVADCSVARR
jgi:hypothetical protein